MIGWDVTACLVLFGCSGSILVRRGRRVLWRSADPRGPVGDDRSVVLGVLAPRLGEAGGSWDAAGTPQHQPPLRPRRKRSHKRNSAAVVPVRVRFPGRVPLVVDEQILGGGDRRLPRRGCGIRSPGSGGCRCGNGRTRRSRVRSTPRATRTARSGRAACRRCCCVVDWRSPCERVTIDAFRERPNPPLGPGGAGTPRALREGRVRECSRLRLIGEASRHSAWPSEAVAAMSTAPTTGIGALR